MEIILTEDVPKLGNAGDIVRVKGGYARNYLLPLGKAMLATRGRVADLEHKRRVIEDKQRKAVAGFEAQAKAISQLEFEFAMNASEEGKLFGSVTNANIAERLKERGFEVDRRKIQLDEHIKQVGEYEVSIRLHRDVSSQVKIRVVSSEAPAAELDEAEAAVTLEAVGTGDSEESDSE
jgi:large subunit ribosomal protein L9